MKNRFRLYRRTMGGVFYVHDSETGKQESLGTRHRAEATTLLNARNESVRQPQLNLQIAKAYLAGTDSGVSTRTWQNALDAIVETKTGSTKDRWRRAAKETALDLIRNRVIIETQAEQLLACLKAGTVSTNVHLRKLHSFCLSMNWLPWPLIPKRLWPEVRFQPKRAITFEEHQLIIQREKNLERCSFYELCWHLGGSQTDIANLKAEDVDWSNQTIAYARRKTGSLAMIHFGEDIEVILRRLPGAGALFPYLQTVRAGDRATEFKQRCEGLGIKGVSLHSYRYAWAERAKQCGYPERFAQEALGHNSKAVHRAYARKAKVKLPSLESYERQATDGRVIPLPSHPSENRPGHFRPVRRLNRLFPFGPRSPVAGVSSAPILTNRIARAGGPFLLLPQLLKSLGSEELRGIAGRMTERFQQTRRNQNRNVMRLKTKKSRGLGGVEAGRGNLLTQKFSLLREFVHARSCYCRLSVHRCISDTKLWRQTSRESFSSPTDCVRIENITYGGLPKLNSDVPRDENLEARLPGGGGRVRGGTEAGASKRPTRSILDATDAAIQSNRDSSRCHRCPAEWLVNFQSLIEESEMRQSPIYESSASTCAHSASVCVSASEASQPVERRAERSA